MFWPGTTDLKVVLVALLFLLVNLGLLYRVNDFICHFCRFPNYLDCGASGTKVLGEYRGERCQQSGGKETRMIEGRTLVCECWEYDRGGDSVARAPFAS